MYAMYFVLHLQLRAHYTSPVDLPSMDTCTIHHTRFVLLIDNIHIIPPQPAGYSLITRSRSTVQSSAALTLK